MFFKKNPQPNPAFDCIIAGLGNPGPKYELTRHNAGFLCLDLLAQKQGIEIKRLKFKSLTGEAVIGGKRCLLLKPQTFMNCSGEAVRDAAAFYRLPPGRVIIIFDDASLPPGKIRVRAKGSDGGHKGVRSIIECLNSDEFPRVKIGVGEKPRAETDIADWVLSRFDKKEFETMRAAMEKAIEALPYIAAGDCEKAMNLFNSF